MKLRYLVACCICVPLPFTSAFAEKPTQEGKVVLFGNLPTNSSLSDDFPAELSSEMPIKHAFEYAHQHGLDFLAITDHHKRGKALAPQFPKTYATRI